MSKLKELIQQYCPDGVEYKTVDSLCGRIFAGGTPKTNMNEYYDGEIPWIRSGEINFNVIDKAERNISEEGLNNSSAKWIKPESVLIAMTGATVARSATNAIPLTANQSVCAMEPDTRIIDHKFLYYWIESKYLDIKSKSQGALTSINLDFIKRLEVPVPALPVQREIARILGEFSLLSAELAAELAARKQQYEYYRDKLLTFKTDVEEIKLSEICDVYDGTHQTPNYKDSGIKFASVENIKDVYNTTKYISEEAYQKNYKIKPQIGDVLMTRIGDIGTCYVIDRDEPIAYYVSLALIRPKSKINSTYLKYIIESGIGKRELRKRTLVNAVPIKINKDDIGKIIIPVPSMEIQERIVNVLDNFDAICSDLNIGLPAEIEARQKQYEYYRNMLLSFETPFSLSLSLSAKK